MAPTDRIAPTLYVKLRQKAGEDYRLVTDRVIGFKYTDREKKADLCKIQVSNWDLANFDDPVWRKGAQLVVQWGYPGNMSPAREVVITGVKGFKILEVEATAKSVVMNQIPLSRCWENTTITAVVRQIATEGGYGPTQQFIDEIAEVHEVISQSNLTDAQFLRRWASKVGVEFYVDFDGFHFHERKLAERPIRTFRYHDDPNQGDIIGEPSIENDLTAKPGRARVRGRNPETREEINEVADNNTDSDRTTLTSVIEMIDPDTGRGDLVERNLASEATTATADATPEAAQTRARARFRRAQQVAIKMSFPVSGDPQLFAKSVVKVEGMGKRLSVRYWLEEVEHDLTTDYKCNLKMVTDGHGGHSTKSVNAMGLSGVDVAGVASGRGRNRQVQQQLQAALEAAQASGDTASEATIQRVMAGYQRGGNASAAQAAEALGAIAQNSGADEATRAAAAAAANSLSQRGGEAAAGGNPNQNDPAPEAAEVLEPIDRIDPDTGRHVTSYRQAPSRGTTSGAAPTAPETND